MSRADETVFVAIRSSLWLYLLATGTCLPTRVSQNTLLNLPGSLLRAFALLGARLYLPLHDYLPSIEHAPGSSGRTSHRIQQLPERHVQPRHICPVYNRGCRGCVEAQERLLLTRLLVKKKPQLLHFY